MEIARSPMMAIPIPSPVDSVRIPAENVFQSKVVVEAFAASRFRNRSYGMDPRYTIYSST